MAVPRLLAATCATAMSHPPRARCSSSRPPRLRRMSSREPFKAACSAALRVRLYCCTVAVNSIDRRLIANTLALAWLRVDALDSTRPLQSHVSQRHRRNVRVRACVRVRAIVCARVRGCIRACMHACARARVRACVCACVRVCVCVSVCVGVGILRLSRGTVRRPILRAHARRSQRWSSATSCRTCARSTPSCAGESHE